MTNIPDKPETEARMSIMDKIVLAIVAFTIAFGDTGRDQQYLSILMIIAGAVNIALVMFEVVERKNDARGSGKGGRGAGAEAMPVLWR